MSARRLTLLRHAKAGAKDAPDHARELTRDGRDQCAHVAEHLVGTDRLPQLVLCSSATRTRQTWDLVAQGLPEVSPQVRYLDELYTADAADVLDALAAVPADVTDVLVIGHEPTMSATAQHLAGPGSDPAALALVRVGVPTAALSLLATDVAWADLAPGTATMSAVLTPAQPH